MSEDDRPDCIPPGYRIISDGICGEEVSSPISGMAEPPWRPRWRLNAEGDKELLPGALVRFIPSGGVRVGGCALVLDRGEFPLFKIIPDANPACWPAKVSMLYVQVLPAAAAAGPNPGWTGGEVGIKFPEVWNDKDRSPDGEPYKFKPWPMGHPCAWVMERTRGFPGNEVGRLMWEIVE
jgi:hypothetical protein